MTNRGMSSDWNTCSVSSPNGTLYRGNFGRKNFGFKCTTEVENADKTHHGNWACLVGHHRVIVSVVVKEIKGQIKDEAGKKDIQTSGKIGNLKNL